ncbi:MAG: hypothetical protein QNJ84_09130 [Alphaproteobacteria bacterium]|nr:hypothetical protein [Alphaproteobacteria bacterium]
MTTTLAWLILVAAGALALRAAWRGMRAQIAAEADVAALGDPDKPWRGAERFSGGLPEAEPLDEKTVRADWTPVTLGETVDGFRKSKRGGGAIRIDRRTLERMCDWADKNSQGGWLAILLEERALTFWFERPGDAQAFAAHWTPGKSM